MKLKNLTKKLTTLAITALMATTLVSTQKCISCIKKSTEEDEQSLCTSNQEKQSSQIYKLFIN